MMRHRTAGDEQVRETSMPDTVRLGGTLLVPWPDRGLVGSRSRLAAFAAGLGADRRTVRLLARLRRRYGPGPLRVALLKRRMVLLLSREDVHRILTEPPERFTPASFTPAGAGTSRTPAHFRPHGVPVPPGEDWADRHRVDETVLDSHQQVHGFAGPFIVRVHQEATALLETVSAKGVLTWGDFSAAYGRLARRIMLGDSSRDDRMLTDLLIRLGDGARRPWRDGGREVTRDTYLRRLRMYLERAEPDSLARLLARTPTMPEADPLNQVTRWLAGFGATGVVAYRALTLLAAHPDRLERARAELAGLPGESLPSPVSVPYLRACVLESARLWPPVRTILRESVTETGWHGRTVPAGAIFVVVVPFFNRDRASLPYADRFTPEAWLDGRVKSDGAIVPFGGGSGRCPGENLALLVAVTLLAALVRRHEARLLAPKGLNPRVPVPYGLNHFSVRLGFMPAPPP